MKDWYSQQRQPVALQPNVHVQIQKERHAYDDSGGVDFGRVHNRHAACES